VPSSLVSLLANESIIHTCLFSAKVWGKPNDHPILALHGWQDNAGTFDKLIPLLPSDLYVVCLDFCGKLISIFQKIN
jgi:hypothetical protein